MNAQAAREIGEVYVLERIRAGELVSRAPEDSPYKDWDGTGEACLALDAVIAAGERMTAADRAALARRLMRKRWRGAWDYRGGQGPDADTTAPALRALDRLGQPAGLEGLEAFYNPGTQLFNTFGRAADRRGLELPPQSRAAKARGLVSAISSAQQADGSWPDEAIWDALRVRSTSLCVRALGLWQ